MNHPATIVSKTAPDGTDGNKDALILSTRMLSLVAADQAGATELTIKFKLKQNSNFLVRNKQPSTSPSRGSSRETSLADQCRKGELNKLFLCPGDYTITE